MLGGQRPSGPHSRPPLLRAIPEDLAVPIACLRSRMCLFLAFSSEACRGLPVGLYALGSVGVIGRRYATLGPEKVARLVPWMTLPWVSLGLRSVYLGLLPVSLLAVFAEEDCTPCCVSHLLFGEVGNQVTLGPGRFRHRRETSRTGSVTRIKYPSSFPKPRSLP